MKEEENHCSFASWQWWFALPCSPTHQPSHKRGRLRTHETKINFPLVKLFLSWIWSQWLSWLLLCSCDQNTWYNLEGARLMERMAKHIFVGQDAEGSNRRRVQDKCMTPTSGLFLQISPIHHYLSPNKASMLRIHQSIHSFVRVLTI